MCSTPRRYSDSNFSVLDLDVVGPELDREIELVLPRAHVVLPAMPRTRQDAAPQEPLAERALQVDAVLLDRVEAAVAMSECDLLVSRTDSPDAARRDVLDPSDRDEFHGRDPSNRPYKRGTLLAWRRSCSVGSMSSSGASSRRCFPAITSLRRTAPTGRISSLPTLVVSIR